MPKSKILGRRHTTLVKKAGELSILFFFERRELSILCTAEVAVITFTKDGKLVHEYSSDSVEHTLTRYKNHKGGRVLPTVAESDPPEERRRESAANEEDPKSSDEVLDALKRPHAALELEKIRRTGKVLDGLSREELDALKQQQKGALVSVLKKEELLVRSLQNSMVSEQQAIQEKEILRRASELGEDDGNTLSPTVPGVQFWFRRKLESCITYELTSNTGYGHFLFSTRALGLYS